LILSLSFLRGVLEAFHVPDENVPLDFLLSVPFVHPLAVSYLPPRVIVFFSVPVFCAFYSSYIKCAPFLIWILPSFLSQLFFSLPVTRLFFLLCNGIDLFSKNRGYELMKVFFSSRSFQFV